MHVTFGDGWSGERQKSNLKMEVVYNIEHDLRYFILFGKCIGLYPPEHKVLSKLTKLLPLMLLVVTLVDWVGMFAKPTTNHYITAAEICGKIGSPQFFTFGTFYYFHMHRNHDKLLNIFNKLKKLPMILEDKYLSLFTNVSFLVIMTSAILENICFHFKLFPVLEPSIANKTSFEVYYERAHNFWATIVPFSPIQGSILLLANKLALYSWNYVDLLASIMSRALTFHFKCLHSNQDILGPEQSVRRYEELVEITRLLEKYLSPLIFGSFYMDFYATCMQLHMWMTPSEHKHFLHTIYLLWSFVHLIVRMFLLSYQASQLHETPANVEPLMNMASKPCSYLVRKQISRIEVSQKRQLAISGLGCFFITKKFLLTLIYVAFSFQIFLMQSDYVQCE